MSLDIEVIGLRAQLAALCESLSAAGAELTPPQRGLPTEGTTYQRFYDQFIQFFDAAQVRQGLSVMQEDVQQQILRPLQRLLRAYQDYADERQFLREEAVAAKPDGASPERDTADDLPEVEDFEALLRVITTHQQQLQGFVGEVAAIREVANHNLGLCRQYQVPEDMSLVMALDALTDWLAVDTPAQASVESIHRVRIDNPFLRELAQDIESLRTERQSVLEHQREWQRASRS